jgi:hypothetical protein
MTMTFAPPAPIEQDLAPGEWIDFVDIAAPGAGQLAQYPVIRDRALRVLAATATVSTDANAANRVVSLDFLKPSGAVYVRNLPGLVVVANTTSQAFVWNRAWHVAEWATNTPVMVPVQSMQVPAGMVIRFTIVNIQAGDTLTGLTLTVARLVAPARPGD